MLDVLEWYFPWSRIDPVLKLQLLVWLAVVSVAFVIPIRTLLFKRPWLPMNHLPEPPRTRPAGEPSTTESTSP
jgi:hypothetical protein